MIFPSKDETFTYRRHFLFDEWAGDPAADEQEVACLNESKRVFGL